MTGLPPVAHWLGKYTVRWPGLCGGATFHVSYRVTGRRDEDDPPPVADAGRWDGVCVHCRGPIDWGAAQVSTSLCAVVGVA